MVNLISILLAGGFIGGFAALLSQARQNILASVVTGIIGSFLSGFLLAPLIGSGSMTGNFSLPSLLVSIFGSMILLGVLKIGNILFRPKESRQAPVKVEAPVTSTRSARELTIFVSYRREDTADSVGRIYDRLAQHFGKTNVFKDVDSIPFGADFRKHLNQTVGQCSVLLAVIGRNWLAKEAQTGACRLDDPSDFVRIEIEVALQRDIPIVPLLLQGALMPSEHELPTTLQGLAYRQGMAVRPDPDFHRDMDRLIEGLESYYSKSA